MLSCKDILHKGKKLILTFICWIWARKAFTSPEASSFTTACSPGHWKLDFARDFHNQLCQCWCHPSARNKQYPQKSYEAHRIADEFCPLRKFQSAQCLQCIAAKQKNIVRCNIETTISTAKLQNPNHGIVLKVFIMIRNEGTHEHKPAWGANGGYDSSLRVSSKRILHVHRLPTILLECS